MSGDSSTMELLISDLRRALEVGLTKVDGQLGLLLQRAEQSELRDAEIRAEQEKHDLRIGHLEQHAVTHDDLDRRTNRIIAIVGLIVTTVGIVVGAVITLVPH